MEGLDDRIYKFVIVGRIIFIATLLATLVILTMTTISVHTTTTARTMQNPDSSLVTRQADDPEVPVVGDEEESIPEPNDSETTAETATMDTIPEEAPATAEANPQPAYTYHPSYSYTGNTASTPTVNTPTPTPQYDYNQIVLIDDNGTAIDSGSEPIIYSPETPTDITDTEEPETPENLP